MLCRTIPVPPFLWLSCNLAGQVNLLLFTATALPWCSLLDQLMVLCIRRPRIQIDPFSGKSPLPLWAPDFPSGLVRLAERSQPVGFTQFQDCLRAPPHKQLSS